MVASLGPPESAIRPPPPRLAILLGFLGACGPDSGALDTGVPPDAESGDLNAVKVRAAASEDSAYAITLSWETPFEGLSRVEFGLDETLGRLTPWTATAASAHEISLLGLPADTEVWYRVTTVGDDGEAAASGRARTGTPPDRIPTVTADGWDPRQADAPYLLMGWWGATAGLLATDREGRVLWAETLDGRWIPSEVDLSEDCVVRALLSPRTMGKVEAEFVEFDLLGHELDRTEVEGAHHGFASLPDGSVAFVTVDVRIWTEEEGGDGTHVAGDAITVAPTWLPPRVLFSTWDWSDPVPNDGWTSGYHGEAADWTHANALDYRADTGTLLMGLRNPDVLLEVDAQTGAFVRQFGAPGGYGLVEGSRPIEYPHSAAWTPEGTLVMTQTRDELVAVEYAVDDASGTLAEVWSYGDGLGLYTLAHGSVVPLAGGNRLVTFGATLETHEVTGDGTLAWRGLLEGAEGVAWAMPFHDFYPPCR